ncbi:GNAT family N-acetyltransferase [Candidatus Micrarchaeota archaeon]|nr:GNAT family N-acetyltransferase [Candidatus Micrarchaeota archaeon]
MKLVIEKADKKDLDELLELSDRLLRQMMEIDKEIKLIKNHGPLKRKYYLTELKNPNSVFFKAVCDGKTVGFVFGTLKEGIPILKDDDYGNLNEIYLLPEFRRKGIGHRLMKSMRQWFKKKGVKWMRLYALVKNKRAQTAYKKFGFMEFRKIMRMKV